MFKKISLKILLTFIMIISFNSEVFADTSINVHKYVSNVSDINNTFYYDIIPSNENPDSVTGLVSNFEIVFDENTEISNVTAHKEYTIDFSDVVFDKVGVYKFKVIERESENEKVYPRDTNTYIVLVNVTHDVNSDNEPTNDLLVDVNPLAIHEESNSKSEVRFDTNPHTYLSLSKRVTGDMADSEKYFKFKIKITGGDYSADGIKIVGQDEVINYEGQTINTISTYDSNIDNYVYLKHGQKITIGNDTENNKYLLSGGTMFTIEEEGAQEYITYINGDRKDHKSITLNAVSNIDKNEAKYVNNYESTALTGVFVRIVPFVVLLIISIGSFILVNKRVKE